MEKLNFSVFTLIDENTADICICVGNSGLQLGKNRERPSLGTLDYTPEGNCNLVDNKRIQYALTFLTALGSLCEWFQNEEAVDCPEVIRMDTNQEMASFLVRHLEPALLEVDYRPQEKVVEVNFHEMLQSKSIKDAFNKAKTHLARRNFQVAKPGLYPLPDDMHNPDDLSIKA
jgi:hypothetical protein